jgi:hypothetical protein
LFLLATERWQRAGFPHLHKQWPSSAYDGFS